MMPYKEGKKWRATPKYKGTRGRTKWCGTKKEALEWERQEKDRLKESELRQRKGMDLLTLTGMYLNHAERYSTKTYQEKQSVCKRVLKAWGRQPQYVPPIEDVLKILMVATRIERIFLDCYLQTGARRSEIFRWAWHEDINIDRRKVRLGSRKSRDGSMKYRWIDMNQDLYDNLRWLLKNRKFRQSPYVWVNDNPGPNYGEPYKYRHRFLPGLCKRAGVKKFGFHALRRFVASVLQDSGKVSLKKIQLLLGHSNLTTTERYIYHLGEDLKSTVEVLSEIKRHEGQARNEKEANHENG